MNKFLWLILVIIFTLYLPLVSHAQEQEGGEGEDDTQEEQLPPLEASLNASITETFVSKAIAFEATLNNLPEDVTIQEVLWNFGDGVRTTGERVSHAYRTSGTYTVTVTLTTNRGDRLEDEVEVEVFEHVLVLITDMSVPDEQIQLKKQQAAAEDVLLVVLRSRVSGPEVLVEEQLTNQLIDARDAVRISPLLLTWTQGSVGPSVLSQFAQHVREAQGLSFGDLDVDRKGIIILTETPFGVLAPTAQSTFDQLNPSYALLTRPAAIDLLLQPITSEQAKEALFTSAVSHRLFGTFSARTVQDIGPTNFLSFGLNFLINRGVPLNSITLILMLPVIATILSFSRQVIGIKAFGIVTPAMTTLSFLVLGLTYGLIIFSAVLLAGTVTRLVLRRLHLLYLPRMALVLTSVSFAILLLFTLGVLTDNTALLSFSIFPILILTLLAEEFISVQFKSGARQAATITAWTFALSILGYFIVSWQLFRTTIISYPEFVLLAIPINLLLGRWTGLRLTEYFRFRKLVQYLQ